VDPPIDVPHGPHRCQKNGTVSIPKRLLEAVGMEAGEDDFHWALNPDMPGTLLLIPSAVLAKAMPGIIDSLRKASR
jgi:hypothetical protein